MKNTIDKATSTTLGVTMQGKRDINQDTWLWNENVKKKVASKETLANWQIYKNANREAKKAVAVTRADHYKNLYDILDTRDCERDLYRRTQDIELFCSLNDKNGTLLTDRQATTDSWREYFEQISTEEFAHPPLSQSLPT